MNEFQEIPPCGGKIIITISTDCDGKKKYTIGIRHERPSISAAFAVYALPEGIPVETMNLVGLGQSCNPPPYPNCFIVFIFADNTGFFAHFCAECKNSWRSKSAPFYWLSTCPYCGVKGKAYQFLTKGQHNFVKACCEMFNKKLDEGIDGEYFIDLDEIADAVNAGAERPALFYVEETQQNNYKCEACRDFQDILGQFGYCSCCGTRNDLQEFSNKIIPPIREKSNKDGAYEACVRDAVSAFDSYAGKYVAQLLEYVPLTPTRKNRIKNVSFHNLEKFQTEFKEIFGIDIFEGLKPEETIFATLMFHRRHVYEHGGGEADEKYIQDSGDTAVKSKQSLRETQDSANRIVNHVLKMAKNVHQGFHSMFPPEKSALRI